MRKMATLRRIDDLQPILDADRIELATLDGWKVVVGKDRYKVGEMVIYCEVDSWIPHEIDPTLTKPDKFPKEYLGIPGQKLKTAKIRKQLSQGLVLPLEVLNIGYSFDFYEDHVTRHAVDQTREHFVIGDDVSEFLGIVKWEAPENPQIGGQSKGSFPSDIPKTDQERIQNIKKELNQWIGNPYFTWEVTEKLEGTSATFYLNFEGEFLVCSRNVNLKESEDNLYWKIARKNDVENFMRDNNLFGFAIQGEVIGEGIQGNIYKLKGQEFFTFDVYDVKRGEYLLPHERRELVKGHLKHVPILATYITLEGDVDTILEHADGISALHNTKREGEVYKCNERDISFKAVSNQYLLKEK